MRQQAAKSMRRLAEGIQRDHPELAVHDHVRDAARTLESGNEEASQRHLRAAMYSLTPQSLMRNGVHDDLGHISARQAVHGVHRHLLLVKDIADVAAKNQAAIRRDSYGDYESGPTLPHADPNAGYGPGALAQKPQARQPGGDRALNAPDRTNSGGSDPNVADPVGPQPRGSKQFARTRDELVTAVDLAGPKGYEHGWRYVGAGSAAAPGGILTGPHPADRLTVTADPRREARAMSDDDLRRADAELARRAAMLGKPGQLSRGHKAVVAERKHRAAAKVTAHARTWDELSGVLDLSAETGRLAVTPAPYGKPGGPGLYGVKGNTHSPYFEQIVKGLMEKRGMSKGQASAIAWGALRKWSRGGGHVHPEVRATAAGALAGEKAAQARAHAHANTWDELGGLIDLAAAPRRGWDGVALELAAALPVRVPAGTAAGGQFGAAQGSTQPAPAGGKAAQKAALLKAAAADKAKAKALIKAIIAAQAQIATLAGKAKASTAKTAKATAATGKTVSASANKTAASAPAAPAKPAAAKAAAKPGAKAPTKAQQVTTLKAQVTSMQGQVKTLMASAAQATAQAAKL